MIVRYPVFGLVLAVMAGCVELGQMLGPQPGIPPAPVFNDNDDEEIDNVSTNGNANTNGNDNENENENDNANGNDNENGNDNANANSNDNSNVNENENDNDTDPDDVIFGGVGDIPPIEGEVETTASGLKFIDIEVGGGEMPLGPSTTVTVNYVGWLTDGTEFDSGNSVQFSLGGVIAGWTEGVGSMRVSGRRRLLIPPDLAYGEQGSPPTIPPSATLVFDVDLIAIQE